MSDMSDICPIPEHGWTCFHCGETFTTVGSAKDHFGTSPAQEAGCVMKIKLGGERGLMMELRKREAELSALRTDLENDLTSTRVFYARLEGMLQGYKPFRKCRTIQDVFNVYDSLEGELTVANQKPM